MIEAAIETAPVGVRQRWVKMAMGSMGIELELGVELWRGRRGLIKVA